MLCLMMPAQHIITFYGVLYSIITPGPYYILYYMTSPVTSPVVPNNASPAHSNSVLHYIIVNRVYVPKATAC